MESNLQEFRSTTSSKNLGTLQRRVQELEKENYSLRARTESLQSRVNKAEREADKTLEKVNKVLSKLPDEMADRFVKEWKAPGVAGDSRWRDKKDQALVLVFFF